MNAGIGRGGVRERAREVVLAGVRGPVSDDDDRRVLAVLAYLDRDR